MDIRATLALVIDSLNSSVDRNRMIRQRNISHLQTAQLTNPHTGHQRNKDASAFPSEMKIDALNQRLLIISGQRNHAMDALLFANAHINKM